MDSQVCQILENSGSYVFPLALFLGCSQVYGNSWGTLLTWKHLFVWANSLLLYLGPVWHSGAGLGTVECENLATFAEETPNINTIRSQKNTNTVYCTIHTETQTLYIGPENHTQKKHCTHTNILSTNTAHKPTVHTYNPHTHSHTFRHNRAATCIPSWQSSVEVFTAVQPAPCWQTTKEGNQKSQTQ